jgi:hypothetical protein
MQLARPAFAPDPRRFGRAPARAVAAMHDAAPLSDDFKLFAMTFDGGFLFVSVLIG